MKCEECTENLSSLIFDELSEELTLRMHEHLADCDSCREMYIELVDTHRILEESLTDTPAVSGLTDEHKSKISAAASDEADTAKKTIIFPSWIFAAAACLVIGVIITLNSPVSENKNLASDYKSNESVSEEKELAEKAPALAEPQAEAMELEEDSNDALKKSSVEKRSRTVKNDISVEDQKQSLMLDQIKEEKKEVAKASEKMKKQKLMDKPEENSVAPAVRAGAQSFGAELSPRISVKNLIEFLNTKDKDKTSTEDEKALLERLKSLPENQIQLLDLPKEKTTEKAAQKILVRILNNGQKAIDYAHIFVHNQNIIRVERVK